MVLFVPTTMGEWVGSPYQTPIARVVIANQTALRVTEVGVELGFGQQSCRARFTVMAPTLPTWRPGDAVLISLGFAGPGGGVQPVFGGEVVAVDLAYFPHTVAVECAGYLRRLQPTYVEEGFAYSSVTDGFLWEELMRKSLVPRYATGPTVDEGIVYGGRKPVEVEQGGTPRDLVDKLDQSSPGGYTTWEFAGAVFRTRVTPVPAGTPTFRYGQGAVSYPILRLLEVRRRDTVENLNNRVVVDGLPEADGTRVYADRRADSPYVPQDPDGYFRDNVFSFSSDIIENRTHCDLLAQRYMSEQNRRRDELDLRVPLNPYLMPGATIGLTAEKLGLSTERMYWIKQVAHEYGASGAFSRVQLIGGAGDTGYLIGLDPVAIFTFTVSSEFLLVDGVSTLLYTVVCDGSASFDPDGQIVSYDWFASTGPSGTGPIFTVAFTAAQWEAEEPPTVTLTVTDGDTDPTGPHTGTRTETISGDATPLISRTIYVAAAGQAECTPDGGATWNVWTPPSGQVISTPEIAPIDHSYFGLDNGELYRTDDALFSAPTLVHDFPGRVECVWVNEADNLRVWVGLSDGHIWFTAQADLREEAGWVDLIELPDPVLWVNESYLADGQVRACAGTNVYITHDAWSHYQVLTTLAGGEAKRIALSFFGNYASGEADAPVVHEDSTAVAFSGGAPADARITAFADRDSLLAIDETGQCYVKGEGSDTLTALSATGIGACGHVVRDGEQPAVFYAAGADALAKSYDRGASWHPLRDYAGTTLYGRQVGYGAAPLLPPARLTVLRRASTEYPLESQPVYIPDNGTIRACSLINPTVKMNDTPPPGWYTRAFDDTVYWYGLNAFQHEWGAGTDVTVNVAGHRVWQGWDFWTTYPENIEKHIAYEKALFRHTFTLPAGFEPQRVFLDTWNVIEDAEGGDLRWARAAEVYVNDTAIPNTMRAWLDPGLFVADGVTENLIAVLGNSHRSLIAGWRVGWSLVFSNSADTIGLYTAPDGSLIWTTSNDATLLQGVEDPGTAWSAPPGPEDAPKPVGAVETESWVGQAGFIANNFGYASNVAGFVWAAVPAWEVYGPNGWATHRYKTVLPADLAGKLPPKLVCKWRAYQTNAPDALPDDALRLFLNGTPLEGGELTRVLNVAGGLTRDAQLVFTLDPALLRPGQVNVFSAMLYSQTGSTPHGWLAWHMELR